MSIMHNTTFVIYLAVFDPISLLVAHWGISRLAATGIVAAAGIAATTAVIYVAYLSYSRLMSHVSNARMRNKCNEKVKIIKETRVNGSHKIDVIDINGNGYQTGKKTFVAKDLDPQIRRMANITIQSV